MSGFNIKTPEMTFKEWQAVAVKALAGRDLDTLIRTTYDNISIQPVYRPCNKAIVYPKDATSLAWTIAQRIDQGDIKIAADMVQVEHTGGATGLTLVFNDAPMAYGFGLNGLEEKLFQALFQKAQPAATMLRIEAGPCLYDVATSLHSYMQDHALDSPILSLGYDPLGIAALQGKTILSSLEEKAIRARLLKFSDIGLPGFILRADGRIAHNAGASPAQELAFVLASAVSYLRSLEKNEFDIEQASQKIEFAISADTDQFMIIAKMRALRRLWNHILHACGALPKPAYIHAETAWRMMTRYDPHVNMLRTTVASLAAAAGGANSLSILPFTQPLGLPDAFARRMAHNTHLILMEEAGLHHVADPAAGSGYMEHLSNELTNKAYELFQDIETQGGLLTALKAGVFQNAVARTRKARRQDIAERKEAFTGTSSFPNLDEQSISVLIARSLCDDQYEDRDQCEEDEALKPIRLTVDFEILRQLSDQYLAHMGKRPQIFCANLGARSDYDVRMAFARMIFEAGGIELVAEKGFSSPTEAVDAFSMSGTSIACLCSSDLLYSDFAEETIKSLRTAGAKSIWVVGNTSLSSGVLKDIKIDGYLHSKMDAVAFLSKALSIFELDKKRI